MAADFAAAADFLPAKDLLTDDSNTATLDGVGQQARWLAEYADRGFIYDMNSPYEAEVMAILQETWSKMALGDTSPQDSLNDAEQRVNEIMMIPLFLQIHRLGLLDSYAGI